MIVLINWDSKLSENVKAVPPSGIRKFFDIAQTMKGVISLGVGEPDYAAPDKVIESCIHSLEKKETSYTSNWGLLELRREIAKTFATRYQIKYRAENEILITVGVSEAINTIMQALLNPGDEVLIPDPAYLAYPACVKLASGIPVLVPTECENEFKLTVEELEAAVTDKTKILLIGYPNNPTGTVMDKESLKKIAVFAEKHDLIVISDEIYCDLTYDDNHTCFASLPNMKERTIVLNGFSKSYAMTGLRIGYACGPAEVMQSVCKVHQYSMLCAPVTGQYGAIAALRDCKEEVEAMYNEYHTRREIVYNAIIGMGLPVFKPKGAFYIFPDISSTGLSDEEFCDKLLHEEHVAVVPGSCFGKQGLDHVRISYASSRDNLKEAMNRMARFVKKYQG